MCWEFLRTAGSLTELIVVLARTALTSSGDAGRHQLGLPSASRAGHDAHPSEQVVETLAQAQSRPRSTPS